MIGGGEEGVSGTGQAGTPLADVTSTPPPSPQATRPAALRPQLVPLVQAMLEGLSSLEDAR